MQVRSCPEPLLQLPQDSLRPPSNSQSRCTNQGGQVWAAAFPRLLPLRQPSADYLINTCLAADTKTKEVSVVPTRRVILFEVLNAGGTAAPARAHRFLLKQGAEKSLYLLQLNYAGCFKKQTNPSSKQWEGWSKASLLPVSSSYFCSRFDFYSCLLSFRIRSNSAKDPHVRELQSRL